MIVCPVCEHQQSFGVECEVCGKDLGALGDLGPPPVASAPVEGLEVTVPDRIGEVAVERFNELEVTQLPAAPEVKDRLTDLEASRADVGEVAVERVADLAEDRAPDDGVRTAAPGDQLTCRYCRTVQLASQGFVCGRCGMALPRARPTAIVVETLAAEWVRCRSCGAPAKIGERCGDCGREVSAPS